MTDVLASIDKDGGTYSSLVEKISQGLKDVVDALAPWISSSSPDIHDDLLSLREEVNSVLTRKAERTLLDVKTVLRGVRTTFMTYEMDVLSAIADDSFSDEERMAEIRRLNELCQQDIRSASDDSEKASVVFQDIVRDLAHIKERLVSLESSSNTKTKPEGVTSSLPEVSDELTRNCSRMVSFLSKTRGDLRDIGAKLEVLDEIRAGEHA
ncbi:hypothetical protein K474DRAFT_1665683 [Panus rudis PR-1116 ss-1]|nr:hypothetical protein K474DRAFT_1665683 [Panus rudis PR-1116 ss-1]